MFACLGEQRRKRSPQHKSVKPRPYYLLSKRTWVLFPKHKDSAWVTEGYRFWDPCWRSSKYIGEYLCPFFFPSLSLRALLPRRCAGWGWPRNIPLKGIQDLPGDSQMSTEEIFEKLKLSPYLVLSLSTTEWPLQVACGIIKNMYFVFVTGSWQQAPKTLGISWVKVFFASWMTLVG